ncbi:MAG: hypothetical protein LIO74_08495 [Ruminococcus sp.]|nr:hypothetical protein [Ruminococcus sp.]
MGDDDERYFQGHIITRNALYMPQVFFRDDQRPSTAEEAEKRAVAYFQSIQSVLDGDALCDLRYYVEMNRMIPKTKPSDPRSFAFYTQVMERNSTLIRMINMGMVPNDSPEYQFQSFEGGIKPSQYLTAEKYGSSQSYSVSTVVRSIMIMTDRLRFKIASCVCHSKLLCFARLHGAWANIVSK